MFIDELIKLIIKTIKLIILKSSKYGQKYYVNSQQISLNKLVSSFIALFIINIKFSCL